jgi:hypothetical protein
MNQENFIRRYFIVGERRFSNYWWATVICIGSFGFFFTGLSSYFQTFVFSNGEVNLNSPFFNFFLDIFHLRSQSAEETLSLEKSANNIHFFPQGLLMCFYGSLGFLLSIYWWFLIFWNVGGGFNEFNKKENFIRIFRWGYPGKNRKIDLYYTLKDVESIRVEIQQGFDSQRTIYLKLKGNREIPITGIGQPLTLKEIEKQASELANFLQVSLEGL